MLLKRAPRALPAAPAAPENTRAESRLCIEAGPFNELEFAQVSAAVKAARPALIWETLTRASPEQWSVYMGPFETEALLDGSDASAFARAYARVQSYLPLGNNFYGSGRLELGQVFVKAEDGKQTIEQLLKAKGASVNDFALFVVGEGIEKKQSDFAAEVAAAAATRG